MNFEDIAPILFSSNTHNRGLARLDLDEACYLFSLIKRLKNPRVCEIGTYKGGTTALSASAGAEIDTFDNYSSKTFTAYEKTKPKDDVINLLKELSLEYRVNVYIGDSRIYKNDGMEEWYDVLFIDGDHSYEGVKADYKHWIHTLKEGGQLIFHDSCIAREGATGRPEVMKFMKEISYEVITQVGSITHFIKHNIDMEITE